MLFTPLIALGLILQLAAPAQQTTPSADKSITPKTATGTQAKPLDWPQLGRYRDEDATLPPPAAGEQRVVFLGDSITDAWGRTHGKFFPGKPYLNRGISGQTTPQMLLRFEQDVIALHPALVVILAGTNDLAGNTGPEPMSAIEDNFRAMVSLATSAHIRVILSSVLPATRFPWSPGIHPSESIRELNAWLEQYCNDNGLVFLNYYPALVNADGGMKAELTTDGFVHPNDAGYALMEPIAQAAIDKALAKPNP
jgi:lysophospholipase L1-like esterase